MAGREVLFLPLGHVWVNINHAGCDEVARHGEEAGSEAGLGEKPKLDLIQTDSLVIPSPVPAWDVEEVGLE